MSEANRIRSARAARPRTGMDGLAILVATILGLAAGCTAPGDSGEGGSAASTESPYVVVADVQQLMAHVVEPAAETYWDAVGWIVDYSGTTYIRPQTLEEWEQVRNAAYTVAESGNLLIMEERSQGREAWIGMAQAMIQAAERAIVAAEARDEQGVFDRGAELYYTCTNCHGQFAVETLRPNVIVE